MTQTIALLIDAYRELNARKMFWISLIISGVVIGAFALLGLGPDGLTLVGKKLPFPPPEFWYKYLFSTLVIGLWVSIGALVLALISTSSIFPDLLVGGSIDLYLSKPIGRLRLFLTKYMCGLLFVLLQATVFAVGAFLVFGLRGGQWRPSLLLLIPLTTLIFSYLYVVCVLVGVITRSTLAAILVTCLFWVLTFAVSYTEQGLFAYRAQKRGEARAFERQARQAEVEMATVRESGSITNAFGFRENLLAKRRDDFRKRAERATEDVQGWDTTYRVVRGLATVIPKTGETINLLDRKLFDDEDLAEFRKEFTGPPDGHGPPELPEPPDEVAAATPTTTPTTQSAEAVAKAAEEALDAARRREQRRAAAIEAHEEADRMARSRSVSWVIGTSVGFEVVVLGLAAWVFCRRDY